MESDLADAVVVAYFFCACLYDDVIFVDGGVVDLFVVDGEDWLVVGHGGECEDGWVLGDSAVVDAFVWHGA